MAARPLMNLMSRLMGVAPSAADIRAEIWNLGARHRGQPLEGALVELKAPGLAARRSFLLHACVGKLQGR